MRFFGQKYLKTLMNTAPMLCAIKKPQGRGLGQKLKHIAELGEENV
jgi:hypothetical protein